jgi:hypothetical protein
MTAYSFSPPCITIAKYEGVLDDDLEDVKFTSTSYVVLKNQPFFATLAAHDRPGLFSHCSISISLNYFDEKNHTVSLDTVSYVRIFPVWNEL